MARDNPWAPREGPVHWVLRQFLKVVALLLLALLGLCVWAWIDYDKTMNPAPRGPVHPSQRAP